MRTSERRMQELVWTTLAAAARTESRPEPKRSRAFWPRFDREMAGELAVAWGCLASGMAILGLFEGVPPNAFWAGTVGLFGAVVGVWLARRRPEPLLLPA